MSESRTLAIIDNKGWYLFLPEEAPVRQMLMTHWSDNTIAVGFRTPAGQWYKARIGQDDVPVWEETNARLIGWLHLERSL